MKTIGIIGGMSYESTAEYYKLINDHVKNELGGLNSAKIIINSVNFKEISDCQKRGDWDCSAKILTECAQSLERAGADYVFIATNTMHIIADTIQAGINIPLVHIADATSEKVTSFGFKKAGILATKYTLESDVYSKRYSDKGVELVIPEESDRLFINNVIFEELCKGHLLEQSREEFRQICNKLRDRGAECIILGCTEVMMLIKDGDVDLPIFDTTYIHTLKAAELAMGETSCVFKECSKCCC